MKTAMVPILGLAGLLSLTACRHVPVSTGSSSFRVVEPPAGPPMTATEASTEPTDRSQYREAHLLEREVVLPVYPVRALAAKAGAAQVGVHIVVSPEGTVTDVRPSLVAGSILPPDFGDDFRTAVETAVRQWKFVPARIQQIETVTEQGFTYQRVTRTEKVEAEFDLAFSFSPSGKVEAGAPGK